MRRTSVLWYVARRLAALAVVLAIVSFVVFSLLYVAPGSTERLLLGARPATEETLNNIREKYHLNDPFLTQYGLWLKGVMSLDFGQSIRTGEPVLTGIARRAGITLFVGGYGFLIAMGFGVPLGIYAAVKKRTGVDRAVVGLTVIGGSAPAFVVGLFLLYVFAVILSWFPVFGVGRGFASQLWHLTLPALALGVTAMALVVKLTRAAMIQALEQDYVTFARARGLPRRRVLVGYALRNALVPIVTAGGLILGFTITGSVLVEVTFALPGIGSLLIQSVGVKDVPMVQGVSMVLAFLIVVVNLLTDVLYLFVDPRIRFGGAAA